MSKKEEKKLDRESALIVLSSAKTKKNFFKIVVCDCCSRLDNSIKFYLFEINNERSTSSYIDEEREREKGNANNSRRERKRTIDEYERSSGNQIIRLPSSKLLSKKTKKKNRQ